MVAQFFQKETENDESEEVQDTTVSVASESEEQVIDEETVGNVNDKLPIGAGEQAAPTIDKADSKTAQVAKNKLDYLGLKMSILYEEF